MILRAARGSSARDPPDLVGFEEEDGEWLLEIDHYQAFITDTTGVTIEDQLSLHQIKKIQARLEGCIESYERNGHCACDDFEKYEHIESIRSVHDLSRFFRRLVTTRIERQKQPQ